MGAGVVATTIRRGALALLLAVAAGAPDAVAAGIPADLGLDLDTSHESRPQTSPNPHARLPCTRCHTRQEDSYALAKRYGIPMPLVTEGENVIILCEQCHGAYHGFHPVNVRVTRLAEEVRRAGIFPLQSLVQGIEKLTCTTCHDVHFPHNAQSLLRGFAVDPRSAGAGFATRLDFCRSCHGDELLALSGHRSRSGTAGCGLCHVGRDIAGVVGPIVRTLNQSCGICHPLPRGRRPHFYNYNPFPGFTREELDPYGVFLQGGRFTCATCHLHHRDKENDPTLRAGFLDLVSRSNKVNPHLTDRFCLNCHPMTPPPYGTPGAVAPLREGDVTRLCRNCHSFDAGRGQHHPLEPPSARVRIPAGWPLRKDGSVGCQTCHLAGHGPPEAGNARHLRGGPYEARHDVCFQCHAEESYRGRNVHEEVGQNAGCEFCHEMLDRSALNPAGRAGGILVAPNMLCLPCHAPLAHPASKDHTVRPRGQYFITVDPKKIPLFSGQVTCHSCHDSHSSSIETRFLRQSGFGRPVCENCHPF